MKEVWREICQGIDLKILLITLLSIVLILLLSLILARTFSQKESNIIHPLINPNQTNFTS